MQNFKCLACLAEAPSWEARRVPQSLNTVRGSPWKSRKLASIEFLVSSWVPYTRTGGRRHEWRTL